MKYSGSLLICSTPNLSPELNKSTEVIVGRMAVMLDNNTVTSTTFMIYPDPEIDYLDIDTQLKDIEMNDKLLELKVNKYSSKIPGVTIITSETRFVFINIIISVA